MRMSTFKSQPNSPEQWFSNYGTWNSGISIGLKLVTTAHLGSPPRASKLESLKVGLKICVLTGFPGDSYAHCSRLKTPVK